MYFKRDRAQMMSADPEVWQHLSRPGVDHHVGESVGPPRTDVEDGEAETELLPGLQDDPVAGVDLSVCNALLPLFNPRNGRLSHLQRGSDDQQRTALSDEFPDGARPLGRDVVAEEDDPGLEDSRPAAWAVGDDEAAHLVLNEWDCARSAILTRCLPRHSPPVCRRRRPDAPSDP